MDHTKVVAPKLMQVLMCQRPAIKTQRVQLKALCTAAMCLPHLLLMHSKWDLLLLVKCTMVQLGPNKDWVLMHKVGALQCHKDPILSM